MTFLKGKEICSEVERYLLKGDVLGLLELDEKFAEFETFTTQESTLRVLSEALIFKRYREALKANHFEPFEEFSKPLEQMYLRMRLNLANEDLLGPRVEALNETL